MPYVVTLNRWDDKAWNVEEGYSAAAVHPIKAAYKALVLGSKQRSSFLKIFNALSSLTEVSLSKHQIERVYYLLGLGQSANSNYAGALTYLNKALDVAEELEEWGDIAEIRILRAQVNRGLNLTAQAADDLNECLAIWGEFAVESGKDISQCIDTKRYLEVLTSLAGYKFMLTHFDPAREIIALARTLLPPFGAEEDAAHLDWIESLLAKYQRKPAEAFELAEKALSYYEPQGNTMTLVRLYVLVAEVTLDYAKTLPPGRTRTRLIRSHAEKRIRRGHTIAQRLNDRNGSCLLVLAQARAERMRGLATARVDEIESVISTAREIEDIELIIQAYTTLGDEYVAQGKYTMALDCYRCAVHASDGTEVPAVKQRALLMIRELETQGVGLSS